MFSITERFYSYLTDFNKFVIGEWKKLTQKQQITALAIATFSLFIGFTLIYKLHKFYQSTKITPNELKIQNTALPILEQPKPDTIEPPQTNVEKEKPIKQIEQPPKVIMEPPSPDPIVDALLLKKELLNNLITALNTLGNPEDLKQTEKLCRLKDNPDDVDITPQNVLSILEVFEEWDYFFSKEVDWKDPKIIKLLNIKEFVLFSLMLYKPLGPQCFKRAPSHLREDKQFVLQAINLDENIFAHLKDEFLNDIDIVAAYLSTCVKNNITQPIKSLNNDKAFLIRLMNKTKLSILFLLKSPAYGPFLSDNLRDDFDVSLAILRNNPDAFFQYSSLLENKEWILQASTILGKNSWRLFYYLKDPLNKDPEVILACLKKSLNLSLNVDLSINDDQLIKPLIKANGLLLQLASKELCASYETVLAAVENDGRALKWASPELTANKTIALAALRSHPLAFHYISDNLKEELKDDPYFKNGLMISSNKEQMIDYIRHDYHNFECASEDLKTNPEILLVCIEYDSEFVRLLPSSVFKDKEFLTRLCKIIPLEDQELAFSSYLKKGDPEILLNIIEKNHIDKWLLGQYSQTHYCSHKYRSESRYGDSWDKQTVLKVVQLKPKFYIFLDDKYFNDPEVALAAINKDRNLIHEVSPLLAKNESFALEVLKLNKFFFYLLDDHLKNNPILIAAFQAASDFKLKAIVF